MTNVSELSTNELELLLQKKKEEEKKASATIVGNISQRLLGDASLIADIRHFVTTATVAIDAHIGGLEAAKARKEATALEAKIALIRAQREIKELESGYYNLTQMVQDRQVQAEKAQKRLNDLDSIISARQKTADYWKDFVDDATKLRASLTPAQIQELKSLQRRAGGGGSLEENTTPVPTRKFRAPNNARRSGPATLGEVAQANAAEKSS